MARSKHQPQVARASVTGGPHIVNLFSSFSFKQQSISDPSIDKLELASKLNSTLCAKIGVDICEDKINKSGLLNISCKGFADAIRGTRCLR